ncbi:MAG: hypothetical protein HZC01_00470 [Candidatus Kerfeldbacteria bacterium]|nr:hypothetical protein [Candidatus Kerfeldbacteria bacterium]
MSTATATANTTQTATDTTVDSLTAQCQELQLDRDSVVAAFQTMDALLAGELTYFERSSTVDTGKTYYYAAVDSEITAQHLARKLSCTLPPSFITEPDYYFVVGYRLSEDYGDKPCRVLDMNAYKHSTDYHLPIVKLTYCLTTGTRYYQYITDRGTVYYTME